MRVDAGVESGSVIGGQFDSLLAKLIVTGENREEALARARRALDEMRPKIAELTAEVLEGQGPARLPEPGETDGGDDTT